MATEPDNLVLELLRGMRADIHDVRQGLHDVREDIREIRKVLDHHTIALADLDERMDMLRESTMTALGFATDAGVRQKKLDKQVADLTKRVENLEKAK